MFGGLALFDEERTNILVGQAWSALHRDAHAGAARLTYEYTNAGAYVLEIRLPMRDRIAWLADAVAACRALGERRGEVSALGNLGIAWAGLGEARKATSYEQALAIAREIGDRRSEGSTLGNLGRAWANLGETRKAIELYEQRLAIAREIGDRRGEGNALGNLGIAWADLGEARKAIEFYEQALAIAREIGDRRGEGSTLGNWATPGPISARRARRSSHEQRLAIAREIGDRRGEGKRWAIWATPGQDLGETRKAIEYLRAAPRDRARDRRPPRRQHGAVEFGIGARRARRCHGGGPMRLRVAGSAS